jgi:hypothetical protein
MDYYSEMGGRRRNRTVFNSVMLELLKKLKCDRAVFDRVFLECIDNVPYTSKTPEVSVKIDGIKEKISVNDSDLELETVGDVVVLKKMKTLVIDVDTKDCAGKLEDDGSVTKCLTEEEKTFLTNHNIEFYKCE